MLRDETSLPTVNPTGRMPASITSTSSGSGAFHAESRRTPIGSPGATTRSPVDLKNSSGRSAS